MKTIQRRRNLALAIVCLALVVGLFACSTAEVRKPKQEKKHIPVTILFFNDPHGHVSPQKIKTEDGTVEVGGMARLATLVREIRAENEETRRKTFLFIAGDILQGTPLSTIYQGKPDIEIFNLMGVDALTVGNHEFDFGMYNFHALKNQAEFPFLSANIRTKNNGEHLCQSHTDFSLSKNLALTVIGVTTQELLITTRPQTVSGLALDDSLASVRRTLKNRKNPGPAILLSHSRHRTDRQIAEALPEITAIIGGHDHLLFSPYREVNGVPIFEAMDNGRYLGRIDLAVDPVTGESVIESSTYLPVTAAIKADKEIEKIATRYKRRLRGWFGKAIGRSTVALDGRREHVRYEETTLGNWVTDVMRQYTGAEIALVNSGALRASIDPGPITMKSIYNALPFKNQIIRIDLTGRDILTALRRSVRGNREDEDGGFLQVSGIRFSIQGHKVTDVRIGLDKQPLDQGRIYSVAVTDFLASGGDGYDDIFQNETAINTRLPLREIVVNALRTQQVVTAEKEDRIVRIDTAQ